MGLKDGDVVETATVTLEVERPEGVKEISSEEREGIMGEVMQVVEDGVMGKEVKEEVLAIESEETVLVEEDKKGIEGTVVVVEESAPVVEVAVVAQEVVEIPQQIVKEEVIVQPAVIIQTKALIIEA
jgi:hypothetical protein